MRKTFVEPPTVTGLDSKFNLRKYSGEDDARAWLELRSVAFSRQNRGVQSWDRDDFEREFLSKPWWQPERMWLAELPPVQCSTEPSPSPLGLLKPLPGKPQLIGTVTLAERATPTETRMVLHWLMVAPRFRGQGIATALNAHLERAVWERGARQIYLETHEQWSEAAGLYRKLGYVEEA